MADLEAILRKGPLSRAVAIHNFVAANEDEISFREGQVLDILCKDPSLLDEDGWYLARFHEQVGLVPANFLEMLADQELAQKAFHQSELFDSFKELTQLDFEALDFGRCIGAGQFGRVYEGHIRRDMVHTQRVALKEQIFSDDINSQRFKRRLRELKTEAELLSKCSHPNIARFYGVCAKQNRFIIVLEYAQGGALNKVLENDQIVLDMATIRDWALQIARGMNYLHAECEAATIIHRDLKSSNVLLMTPHTGACRQNTLKICDFGLARTFNEPTKMTTAGTASWMAPEVIRQSMFCLGSDAWSYGVVLWELVTRQTPYEGMEPMQVAFLVAQEGCRLEIPQSCPRIFRQIMRDCWQVDAERRPSFSGILRMVKAWTPLPPELQQVAMSASSSEDMLHRDDRLLSSLSISSEETASTAEFNATSTGLSSLEASPQASTTISRFSRAYAPSDQSKASAPSPRGLYALSAVSSTTTRKARIAAKQGDRSRVAAKSLKMRTAKSGRRKQQHQQSPQQSVGGDMSVTPRRHPELPSRNMRRKRPLRISKEDIGPPSNFVHVEHLGHNGDDSVFTSETLHAKPVSEALREEMVRRHRHLMEERHRLATVGATTWNRGDPTVPTAPDRSFSESRADALTRERPGNETEVFDFEHPLDIGSDPSFSAFGGHQMEVNEKLAGRNSVASGSSRRKSLSKLFPRRRAASASPERTPHPVSRRRGSSSAALSSSFDRMPSEPSNFVHVASGQHAISANHNVPPWLRLHMSRDAAESELRQQPPGSFIVRASAAPGSRFALSVSLPCLSSGQAGMASPAVVWHGMIVEHSEGYALSTQRQQTFSSISELIAHYRRIPFVCDRGQAGRWRCILTAENQAWGAAQYRLSQASRPRSASESQLEGLILALEETADSSSVDVLQGGKESEA